MLTALAAFVVAFATYTMFGLAERAGAESGRAQRLWRLGAAALIAFAGWSIHASMTVGSGALSHWAVDPSAGIIAFLASVGLVQYALTLENDSPIGARAGTLMGMAIALPVLALDGLSLSVAVYRVDALLFALAVAAPPAITALCWRAIGRYPQSAEGSRPIRYAVAASALGLGAAAMCILCDAALGPGLHALSNNLGPSTVRAFGFVAVLGLIAVFAAMVLVASSEGIARDQAARRAAYLEALQDTMGESETRDTVTQLPNRVAFDHRLQQAVARSRRENRLVAVLLVNLDGFRAINEVLGHRAGDETLRIFATRIQSQTRECDTVARLGGDEFVVLMELATDHESIASLASRMIGMTANPVLLGQREVQLSASIGIAVFPEDDEDPQKLLAHADAALRTAKLAGKAQFRFYSKDMDAAVDDLLALQSDLRLALERDEFELHFQPKLAAHSGALCGAEALVRWRHPVRGLVSPALFIPAAERFGLIQNIGHWVLDQAVRQAATWLAQGFCVPVAVNLSVLELRQSNLVERVTEVLARHGVAANMLVLEITESAAMEDAERTLDIIRRLAGAGVKIAIDDFGTGYSSLSYLRRFTAHQIKVDRSFVTDLEVSEEARSIVTAVVQMARALGLRVVAEGVETPRQLEDLTQIGCDELQGYLLDRPLPADEFALRYRDGGRRFVEFGARVIEAAAPVAA